MAENASRFVIIDGVQIEKTRAKRMGLIGEDDKIVKRKGKVSPAALAAETPAQDETTDEPDAPAEDAPPSVDEPTSRRARGADSARRG